MSLEYWVHPLEPVIGRAFARPVGGVTMAVGNGDSPHYFPTLSCNRAIATPSRAN